MKRKSQGLGKGLSALFEENVKQEAASAPVPLLKSAGEAEGGGVTELPIDAVLPGEAQPRKHFDADRITELAESIRENGLIQPIIVARQADGRYAIIAGERRWRACKQAGLSRIAAIVREPGRSQSLEMAIIENIQREDLTAIEEAEGYRRLLDEHGYTQEKLAKRMGKSRTHVTNTLRLLGLPESVRTQLGEGKLSAGHARALLGAERPEELARLVIEKSLSVREVERLAKQKQGDVPAQAPNEKKAAPAGEKRKPLPSVRPTGAPKDEELLLLEESLQRSLNLPVEIRYEGEEGVISLGFASLEELDGIIARLEGRADAAGVNEAFETDFEETM
jgi:ParB family chromosome partitioning protein